MRVDFPGLLIERHRNGSPRYRVRVEGDKTRRIPVPVGPDHPDFANHYWSARLGERWHPGARTRPVRQSLDWLVQEYLAHLERRVHAGQASPLTLKQRRSMLLRLCDHADDDGRYGDLSMDAPQAAFVRVRDAWAATPGAADNLLKSCRAMYAWAMDRGEIGRNPAVGVGKIHRNRGGAVPWTAADLTAFRDRHPRGTTAHLWLTLHMFTACRIGDAVWLGRAHEVPRDGVTWLEWTPGKKGSAPVAVPMMPPLWDATRSVPDGAAYLLTDHGRPFASPESLRNRIRKWCTAAGLSNRTSHGVRKAVAELLAEAGCSQHQIMAVMAHTQAKTSEIYTRGAQRRAMSGDAMQVLSRLAW